MLRRLIILLLSAAWSALFFLCAYCVILGAGVNWTVLDNQDLKILVSAGAPGSRAAPSLRVIVTRFTGQRLPQSQAVFWYQVDWTDGMASLGAPSIDPRQMKQMQQLFNAMQRGGRSLAFGPVSIQSVSVPSVATFAVSDSSLRCWFVLPPNGNRLDVRRVAVDAWLPIIALAIYPTIAFIRGPLRRHRRRKRGLCLTCGYNLTGNTSGVCPECAAKMEG